VTVVSGMSEAISVDIGGSFLIVSVQNTVDRMYNGISKKIIVYSRLSRHFLRYP
jgi:hypothetical protein